MHFGAYIVPCIAAIKEGRNKYTEESLINKTSSKYLAKLPESLLTTKFDNEHYTPANQVQIYHLTISI